jgi:nucleotide sugar dehydrogenase
VDTSGAAAEADVIVVIVPLMLGADGGIDFGNLDSATRAVARGLRRGSLVIYETTLPVGTTRHRVAHLLEEGSGFKAGPDFNLAFSPERLYSGRIFEDLRRYPKIVGGIDEASTERAVRFYRGVLDAEVWPVDSAETAEFAKLAETTYRDVNIALANELALYGANRGVNVAQAFKAANSQPFSHIHRPGIGVGGHCIPVYPHFLLGDAAEGELGLVRDSRTTNDAMARRSVDALATALGGLRDKRVLVLGASYRENVKELAFSTAAPIVRELHRGGAHALIHDPLFEPDELKSLKAEVADLGSDVRVDAVIVQAFHSQYADLDWGRFLGLKVVFDGRGAVDPERIHKAGAAYLAVGVPGDREAVRRS